jgi:hypothetical protein
MGPKWSRWVQNGEERALRRARAQKERKREKKGGPRHEKTTPFGIKKSSKSIRKRVGKHDGFHVALWIDFWSILHPKWYPKGSKLRPKSIRKLLHIKKTGFRCHTVNTMVFSSL